MAGFSIVTRQAGGVVTVRNVDGSKPEPDRSGQAEEAAREYREAQGRSGGGELSEREIRRLAGVLEGGREAREALAEALTRLARSGRPSALATLQAFAAAAPRELAALATLALEECELWGAEPTPLPAPSPLRSKPGADACGCGSGRWRRRCCEG